MNYHKRPGFLEAIGKFDFPENQEQAFPMMSWQHGTEVKRENTSSFNGINVLSLWVTSTGYINLQVQIVLKEDTSKFFLITFRI